MEFVYTFLAKIETAYTILGIWVGVLVIMLLIFKKVNFFYYFIVSILLILVFLEVATIIKVQEDIINVNSDNCGVVCSYVKVLELADKPYVNIIPDSVQKFLFFSACVSMAIIFLIFDKERIKNDCFIGLVGILASIQTVISMNISNSDKYFLCVKIFHGANYIFIPVFLVYVITSGSKEIIEIIKSNKEIIESYNKVIEENRRDMQEIKKVVLSNEKIGKKSKFCKLFKFHSN